MAQHQRRKKATFTGPYTAGGNDAIEKYKAHESDAVTIDIVMPGVDGLAGLRGIIERDLRAKVVLASPLTQTLAVSDAICNGAEDFIVEPFLPEQLRATWEGYWEADVEA